MRAKFILIFSIALMALSDFSWGAIPKRTEEIISVPDSPACSAEGFSYKRIFREKVRNHIIYDVIYPSSVVSASEQNNAVPAELYLPAGLTPESKVPAVVCMHILNGDFALSRMMCSRLSEAGIVAMFFKQPYYGSRGGEEGRRSLLKDLDTLISGFDQSTADARRAFDLIQGIEGVDPDKTGVAGISLGAIRSGALCAFEPRIKRAYLSLVAGDLKQVILSAHETRDLRGFIEKLSDSDQERVWECVWRQDPLNAVPQLRKLAEQKRLRMVRAEKDQIMPPACSIKLFNAVNSPESEICLKGMGHYSAMAGLAGIMDDLTAFFAEDVPESWKPPADAQVSPPVEMIGYLLKDISALLNAAPKEGCAHMIGVQTQFAIKGKEQKFDFELALGNQGRFKLTGNFPEVGKAGFGRGASPWIIGGQKRVFCGTQSFDSGRKLVDLIGPQAILRYRMALGLAAGASLSPDLINNYATLSVESGKNNTRILSLKGIKKKAKGELQLIFDSAGRYPLKAEWDVEGVTGSIDFTHWQINAASDNTIFEPSGDLEKQDVLQQDVLQMFASVFQFLVEYFE